MHTKKLTVQDERLLAFAQLWAPYGGGDPEDIMVGFGLPERVFFQRLLHLLGTHPWHLDNATRMQLAEVSKRRLQCCVGQHVDQDSSRG